MDPKQFKKLVEMAKADSKIFHSLVFEPEKVLDKVDFLDRNEKGALIAVDPGEIVAKLVGVTQWCGNTCTSSCDNTCGQSCGFTTNLQARATAKQATFYSRLEGNIAWCGNTCTSSCDNTCGGSCGFTTNLVDERINVFGRFR